MLHQGQQFRTGFQIRRGIRGLAEKAKLPCIKAGFGNWPKTTKFGFMGNSQNTNFTNPVGLVFRMLKSGSKPARSALLHEALRCAATPVDWLLSFRESRILNGSTLHETRPLILIVGPPRSGTTLVYQVLARALDVSFPTNLSAIFPRSTIYSTKLSARLGSADRHELQSYYGKTAGLGGPNDGFHIWNRWLGPDRSTTTTNLSAAQIREMQNFFNAWTSIFPRPFLNKNNRNTHCIDFLAEHLASSVFVVVNRDPVEIARSLIRARSEVQGSKVARWGLQSQEKYSHHDQFGYVRDVCEQVMNINWQIAEQISMVAPNRVLAVDYHDFCARPTSVIADLEKLVPELRRSPGETDLPGTLVPSASKPLPPEEESILRDYFETDLSPPAPHFCSRRDESAERKSTQP